MISRKFYKLMLGMFLVSVSCQAMEQDKAEQCRDTIAIRCKDSEVRVAKNLAEQALFIKDYFALEKEREMVIDVEPLALMPIDVLKMFSAIVARTCRKALQPEEINIIFEAADCLGAPQWFLRKLTLQGQMLLPEDKQHPKIACGHYLNSIRSLHNEGRLNESLRVINYHNEYDLVINAELDLSNKQLDNLNDIELLGKKYEKVLVTWLNIENNKLEKLDVVQLLKIFPGLQNIRAYNNHIEELILPEKLPDGFFLNLQKNRIKELPIFKTGELSAVNLTGNQLSNQARLVALCAAQPTLLEGQRHRIKAFSDKRMWHDILQVCGRGAIEGVILCTALIGSYLTIKKIMHPEFGIVADLLERLPNLKTRSFLFQVGEVFLGAGLLTGGLYYHHVGYNNNLIYQFKPGTVFLDKDTKE